ncbi:MAG TPA: DUF362 domain-containing protein [Polyangiaceae bacterium]|nr:DUF362 domain-containing protein [Polyangiaceae bacterium]
MGSLSSCRKRGEEQRPATKPAPAASAAPSARAVERADTVTHASEPYDAGPPVVATSSVDGASLRARHIERLKSDRSPVTVLRGDGPLSLGQRICEAVVPARPKATPILLKPNICGFDGFKNVEKTGDDGVSGRVTDAEFVRGVVRCLKARGHERITIAEGCGNSHEHWKKAALVSGFEAMAREEGVPLVALDDDGVFDREGDTPGKPLAIRGIERTRVPTLLMPKLLAETLEQGLFISVPKLKAHRFAVVSLGIKGMQGTVMRSEAAPAYNQKWRMHEELKPYLGARRRKEPEDRAAYVHALELFAERMVDVLEISLPDVVLVDGAPAVAGDGFQKVRKLPGYLAIGGTNPVLVDRVGSQYLGLWNNAALGAELGGHRSSPLIEAAARRYGLDLKEPALGGDGVALLATPPPVYFKAIAPFSLEGEKVVRAVPPDAGVADSGPAPSAAATSPASAADSRPIAHAIHFAAPPRIDAVVEASWSQAPVVLWDTDYAGKPTGIVTQARFAWREGALYALFELAGTELNVDTSFPVAVERPKLYREDCVELFFTPDPSRPKHYYEVELGPFGHFADIEVDRESRREGVDWSSRLEIAASHDAARKTALIEVRFGSEDMTRAVRPGARLPFALYRMEGRSPRQYLAWSPPRTPKPNFHVPEAFGTLVIEP